MAVTEGGKGDGKAPWGVMFVGIIVLLIIVWFASGCASVDSGMIKDKVREPGAVVYDCDTKTSGSGKNKTTKKVCGFETNPDKCMFQLDDGQNLGWSEVPCGVFDNYRVGEKYPR